MFYVASNGDRGAAPAPGSGTLQSPAGPACSKRYLVNISNTIQHIWGHDSSQGVSHHLPFKSDSSQIQHRFNTDSSQIQHRFRSDSSQIQAKVGSTLYNYSINYTTHMGGWFTSRIQAKVGTGLELDGWGMLDVSTSRTPRPSYMSSSTCAILYHIILLINLRHQIQKRFWYLVKWACTCFGTQFLQN